MTPKQARFVQEYLKDLNAKQAAIRTGYSAKTAHVQGVRLLKNAKVKAALAEGQAERAERTEVTQDWVIEQLCANHKKAHEGKEPNLPASNKALELLGRHLAMFTDNVEVKDKRLSREERQSRIDELLDRLGTPGIAGASGAAALGNGSGKPH